MTQEQGTTKAEGETPHVFSATDGFHFHFSPMPLDLSNRLADGRHIGLWIYGQQFRLEVIYTQSR
jgi:hypothetical protein